MNKDLIIQQLHELYFNDPFVNDLFNSSGIELDTIEALTEELKQQMFFDQLTFALEDNEKLLQITPKPTQTIEDRRSTIQGKWLISNKCDLELIQAIANSWKNGEVTVLFQRKYLRTMDVNKLTVDQLNNTYINNFAFGVNKQYSIVKVQFNSIIGVPDDLDTLIDMLNVVIPCHLPLQIIFKYLLVKDINNIMTINQLNNTKINNFAFNT